MNICHECPRRGDCLIADSDSVAERCTYAIRGRRSCAECAAAVNTRSGYWCVNWHEQAKFPDRCSYFRPRAPREVPA